VRVMNVDQPKRVLLIALDSAEPSLVEKWMKDSTLPNLKRFCSQGAYGRLKSSADWLPASAWPTFYTGTSPGEHGLYEARQWQTERMQEVLTSPEWLPLYPFWRRLGDEFRVVSVDLPMTYPPERFNGIEICGWMAYDSIGYLGKPTSYPAAEIVSLRDDFGLEPFSIPDDKWGVQTIKSLLRMRDQLIHATENLAQLAEKLMVNERWDLFLVSFASPHRGGHKLWDGSGIVRKASISDQQEFSHALRDIYVACDKAVGRLAETASNDANVLIFSLHGMRANTNRTHLLPNILDCILDDRLKHNQQPREVYSTFRRRIKETLPTKWLFMAFPNSSLISNLTLSLTSKLLKSAPRIAGGPAFSLGTDLYGYIQINLRGREKNGVVECGEEYDHLCSTIIEDLKTFVDADTEEPIVEQVIRSDELFKSGHRLQRLPDLIVRWSSIPSVNQRTIVSKRYPSVSISMPEWNLDGRSGNHGPEGFLLAIGSGFSPNSQIENGSILDLAPTIFALLGAHKPMQMVGTSLLTDKKRCATFSR
jgi:predicted AlkP superfamily phosphohydrolase/phosphomutase